MNFYGLGLDRGWDMGFNGVHDVREILESLEIIFGLIETYN